MAAPGAWARGSARRLRRAPRPDALQVLTRPPPGCGQLRAGRQTGHRSPVPRAVRRPTRGRHLRASPARGRERSARDGAVPCASTKSNCHGVTPWRASRSRRICTPALSKSPWWRITPPASETAGEQHAHGIRRVTPGADQRLAVRSEFLLGGDQDRRVLAREACRCPAATWSRAIVNWPWREDDVPSRGAAWISRAATPSPSSGSPSVTALDDTGSASTLKCARACAGSGWRGSRAGASAISRETARPWSGVRTCKRVWVPVEQLRRQDGALHPRRLPAARPQPAARASTTGRMLLWMRPCTRGGAGGDRSARPGRARAPLGGEPVTEALRGGGGRAATRSAGRSRSGRPPTRAYSRRGSSRAGAQRSLERQRASGGSVCPGRTGHEQSTRRGVRPGREPRLGRRSRDDNGAVARAAAAALVCRAPPAGGIERRIEPPTSSSGGGAHGGGAHTSSSPCSSSRSNSPSHRNGMACTPKLPLSRWSW